MELRETFRAPFLQMAWQRHGRIAELVGRGEAAELRSAASELHCLSGEASMLAYEDVAEAARVAEKAARESDHGRLVGLVADLRVAIQAVENDG
ncbi:MAG: Hpt domain-containing protein [Labilithrix sp.]|nr:Hpt domain-containing protein [Labilithrix sp.]